MNTLAGHVPRHVEAGAVFADIGLNGIEERGTTLISHGTECTGQT
jgi:hypothetical protein